MNLTVRIHDKEYIHEVAQGVTFTEEYNETLDSGVVRLSHIKGQIMDLKPYDDVYIYESAPEGEDETKWFNSHIGLWRRGGTLRDGDEIDEETGVRIPFYRHLLVDKFSEELINLSEDIYSYSLELFSETKGLEVVQLPNISVTQPLVVSKKIDIYTYLVRFVNLYSPKYKKYKIIHDNDKNTDIDSWEYVQKYTVAPELKTIFGGFYSQDFSLSNPNLRDLLSSLMITLDMIPYVKDNVIYAKAISERTDTYDIKTEKDTGRISRIVGQMGSSDFCDGVRRQYSDALSQDGVCNFIEYLGFRNKNNALLTMDNMRLETEKKIYTVNKFYMCYYKVASVRDINNNEIRKIWFFCKHDITPLVKNSTEWSMLNQDWRGLTNPASVKDLSQYKLSTVHYDIGGNTIDGWGTRYSQYKTSMTDIFNIEKTYVENIVRFMDKVDPWGDLGQEGILDAYRKKYGDTAPRYIFPLTPSNDDAVTKYIYNPGSNFKLEALIGNINNYLSPTSLLKTLFFQIEYKGFYDGAIIHTRDRGNDNIYQNDNVSSSLTLLEKDGWSQKEKLNRFANKSLVLKGRLDGDNYSVKNILGLGSTGSIGADDDVIIYRREYSIFNNYISVSYAGIQDYVLKNFYTSVYAKYRTYQLMSYGESVNRSESKKVLIVLSKNKKMKDEDTFFEIIGDKYGYETIPRSATIPASHGWFDGYKNKIIEWTNIVDLRQIIIGKKYYMPISFNDYDGTGKYIVVPTEKIYDETNISGNLKAKCLFYENDLNLNAQRIETRLLFSAFSQTNLDERMNSAILKIRDSEYAVDSQIFLSGNNLCMDIEMPDNASAGNYLDTWSSPYSLLWYQLNAEGNSDYYAGSQQNWYNIVDDNETGAIEELGLEVNHTDISPNLVEDCSNEGHFLWVKYFAQNANVDAIYNYSKALPKITGSSLEGPAFRETKNNIGISEKHIYKDNKERIKLTLQIEPISNDKNIVCGDYLLRLSDMMSYNKRYDIDTLLDASTYSFDFNIVFSFGASDASFPIYIKPNDNNFYQLLENIKTGKNQKLPIVFSFNHSNTENGREEGCAFTASSIGYEGEYTPAGQTRSIARNIILYGTGFQTYISDDQTAYIKEELSSIKLSLQQPDLSVYAVEMRAIENPKDYQNNPYDVIATCLMQHKRDTLIKQNMFIELGDKTIDNTIIYKTYKNGDSAFESRFSTKKPEDIFTLKEMGEDSILRVMLDGIPNATKSINYWYFDFDSAYSKDYSSGDNEQATDIYSYDPNRSGYHFVFGVNVTEADFERGYIDIYITKTTNRDERVYDGVGRQVGIVHNCIDSNGNYEPPKYQTFDPTAASPNMVKFDVDSLVDNVLKTNSISRYVGEQVPLQCESEIFESWVIGDQVIKKNSYELTVAPEQKAVQLKLSIATPTDYSASSERGDSRQYVNLTVFNPNPLAVSGKGNVLDKNGVAKKEFNEEMGARSTKSFAIPVSIAVNLQDGYVDFRFEVNNISVSPSVRVQIETTT